MAENTIRIRAKNSGGNTKVKTLIKHAMSAKSDKNGTTSHFIQEVMCEHNGLTVFKANWSTSVSKNPYLSFQFQGGSVGDSITISWVDNSGDTDSLTTSII